MRAISQHFLLTSHTYNSIHPPVLTILHYIRLPKIFSFSFFFFFEFGAHQEFEQLTFRSVWIRSRISSPLHHASNRCQHTNFYNNRIVEAPKKWHISDIRKLFLIYTCFDIVTMSSSVESEKTVTNFEYKNLEWLTATYLKNYNLNILSKISVNLQS